MSTLTDRPRFFDVNFVDIEAVITASTGDATKTRIFDRDVELKWQSVGSDDTTQESLEIRFQSGGNPFSRKFDRLFVLGHNIKDFKAQYWTGAAWADITGAVTTTETDSHTFFEFTELDSERVRLLMNKTQVVDDEKQVGEVLVLKSLLEFDNVTGPDAIPPTWMPVVQSKTMGDGGFVVNQLRGWAGNRVRHYSTRMRFTLFKKADYDTLQGIVDGGVFTFFPEPGERPEEIFEVVAILSPWDADYTVATYKAPGYSLSLDVREI